MKAVAKTVEPAAEAGVDHILPQYIQALTMVERLHRRLLDVIKDEFDRRGRVDINSVQALLLFNIGENEVTAGELRTRGYYQGSNVSYNLKKLVEMGFIDHQRSPIDRRSVRIKLTERAARCANRRCALPKARAHGGAGRRINPDEFAMFNKSMHRLERFWTIRFSIGFSAPKESSSPRLTQALEPLGRGERGG